MSFSKFSVQHFIALFQWICSPFPIKLTVFTVFHHKTLFIMFTKEKERKNTKLRATKVRGCLCVCVTTSNIAIASVQYTIYTLKENSSRRNFWFVIRTWFYEVLFCYRVMASILYVKSPLITPDGDYIFRTIPFLFEPSLHPSTIAFPLSLSLPPFKHTHSCICMYLVYLRLANVIKLTSNMEKTRYCTVHIIQCAQFIS